MVLFLFLFSLELFGEVGHLDGKKRHTKEAHYQTIGFWFLSKAFEVDVTGTTHQSLLRASFVCIFSVIHMLIFEEKT